MLAMALSYGLGLGVLAHILFLIGILRLQYHFGLIAVLMISLGVLTGICLRVRQFPCSFRRDADIQSQKINWINGLVLFYIWCSVLYAFWRAMHVPIGYWDEVATSSFVGKVVFFDKSLPALSLLPHSAYPLTVPLIQTWISLGLGYWDEQLVKLIFPLAFLSYVGVHYSFLLNVTNRRWAIAGTALLISSNFLLFQATIAYRDLFMLYYNCTAILLLLLWHRNKDDGFLVLAGLYSGLMTFIKLEGLGYLFLHTLLLAVLLFKGKTKGQGGSDNFRGLLKRFRLFAVPGYAIGLFFYVYKLMAGIAPADDRIRIAFSLEQFLRIPHIINRFLAEMFFIGGWNIVWFFLAVSWMGVVCLKKQLTDESKMLGLMILAFLVLYGGLAFLPLNFPWLAGPRSHTTLSRGFLHFSPLAVLLAVLLNFNMRETKD